MNYIKLLKEKIYPKKLLTRSVYILITLLSFNFIILTSLLYTNHWDKIRYKLVLSTFNDFYYLVEDINQTSSIAEANKILEKASSFSLNMKMIPKEAIISKKLSVKNKTTSTLEKLLASRYSGKSYKVLMIKQHRFTLKQHLSPDYDIYIYYHSQYGWIVTRFSSSLVSSSSVAMLSTTMVLLSILLTLLATIATNKQLMPLKQLAKAARKFGRGEKVENLRIRGASEIRIAALSFNRMKNDINNHIKQKSLLLGAISHDLKTPLTKIKLMLSIEENITVKNELNAQLKLMDDIINSYLSLLSEELLAKEKKNTKLCEILNALISQVNETLAKKPELDFKADKEVTIKAHSASLIRAFYNLVNNAYNHATNCRIVVEKNPLEDCILIHIDDDGKGVKKENIKSIFLPFFKEETARTQNKTHLGSGLGLAIVKEITKKHNGKVFYSNKSSLKGARFTISIPIAIKEQ